MERIAGDVEALHLGRLDADALLVGPLIERAFDLEAGLRRVFVVVAPISSTTAIRLSSGWPRQFCVMWQNMRCSILFHFDVPGG